MKRLEELAAVHSLGGCERRRGADGELLLDALEVRTNARHLDFAARLPAAGTEEHENHERNSHTLSNELKLEAYRSPAITMTEAGTTGAPAGADLHAGMHTRHLHAGTRSHRARALYLTTFWAISSKARRVRSDGQDRSFAVAVAVQVRRCVARTHRRCRSVNPTRQQNHLSTSSFSTFWAPSCSASAHLEVAQIRRVHRFQSGEHGSSLCPRAPQGHVDHRRR